MKTEKTLHESFEEELNKVSKKTVFDSEYRKKKLFFWIIRTSVLSILYVIFWKQEWVRNSLYFIAPLSLVSLFTIIAMPFLINKKNQKTIAY